MSLLDTVRNKLVSAGIVEGTTGYRAYIGYAPDDNDKIVGLMPYGGQPQDTHQGENSTEMFQVKVRAGSLDYAEAETKTRAVLNCLQDASLTDVNLIQAMSMGPMCWYDENSRPNFSLSFRVIRRKP